MATESKNLPLGSNIIEFSLFNPKLNTTQSLKDLKGEKGTLIVFMCNHCPYVIHILPKLVQIADEYSQKGINFIGITSNDITNYPEDSPENMIKISANYKINFPYLYDETQSVARSYDAACTPDFYLYDGNDKLVYHARFDASRPNSNVPTTGEDLIRALNCVLENKPIDFPQYNSIGCSIKWK